MSRKLRLRSLDTWGLTIIEVKQATVILQTNNSNKQVLQHCKDKRAEERVENRSICFTEKGMGVPVSTYSLPGPSCAAFMPTVKAEDS